MKIDNDSYYNGNRCTNTGTQENPVWQWQGPAGFPVPGTSCTTSFESSDLGNGLLFFDFDDLKPDDEGEDTISIDIQNDAYACMNLTLTSDDDVSSNEPELEVDIPNTGDAWDGELADALQFFWWADDGDNVYEVGENPISNGVQTLTNLATTTGSFSVVLADSENNVWSPNDPTPDPLPGGETVYIAKAWCMGTLGLSPLVQDGFNTDGPQLPNRVGSGFTCDGTLLGNETQTDGVELSIMFSAVQARHNPDFLCNPPVLQLPILRVNKTIQVDTVGISVEDFQLHIDGPIPGSGDDQVVSDNIPVLNLPVGIYTVSEVIIGDVAGKTFTTTFSGACDPITHQVTLGLGDNLVCNILNVENP